MLDVAKEVGVSIATVSRVINGDARVAGPTRRRVEEAIVLLGYRHNAVARSLATGRSGVLGVVIPDVVGPLYGQIARGIEDVLDPQGMEFTLVTSDRDAAKEAKVVELLVGRNVDGLVVVGSLLDLSALQGLMGPETPVVFVQREGDGETGHHGAVMLDNAAATELALTHLYDAGHRAIAHVAGVRRDGAERLAAYLDFMRHHHLTAVVVPSDSTEQGGIDAVPRLEEHPGVTAVYCTNDRVALGIYRALARQGRGVPDYLSVVGFDDLPWCAYVDPPLTTLRQDGHAMGRAAARIVLDRRAGRETPWRVTVGAELVLRESVAAPRPVGLGYAARKEVG